MKVVGERTRRSAYGVTRSRTATKTDTPLRDTPQSATVLSHALIADQSMQSMADVVRYIPGVTMAQGEGHRDAPVIRGQSSTADFFVDGVRDDAQYLRDLYNVERVEALKGSNAMIFGRGGGGGIINQVRREASWAPISTLTL
ncbi:MAG TPA: TonB-dependent receptor plug domain-containing protein, partial [Gemmatimonadaceae bacterium]